MYIYICYFQQQQQQRLCRLTSITHNDITIQYNRTAWRRHIGSRKGTKSFLLPSTMSGAATNEIFEAARIPSLSCT